MAILVGSDTRLIVQGITGRDGSFHTGQMLSYGTRVVGGIRPGKGGTTVAGVPVFNTVKEAARETNANTSIIFIIFVLAAGSADAIMEAASAGLPLVVSSTEGTPIHAMVRVRRSLRDYDTRLTGSNCPGVITLGAGKVGIMPSNVFAPGGVGLISRSGTLARGSTKGYPSVVIYRHVLVTGGAGFVGSNLAIWLATHHPEMRVVAADNLRRRGAEATLPRLRAHNVTFAHCDVRSPEDLQSAVLDVDVDLLIDCSAEPSVRAGYGEAPIYAINTNLMGLVNCLELARRQRADVLFLSTSRVYPIAPLNDICTTENATRLIPVDMEPRAGVTRDGITEDFPLAGPRSLYGATKLAGELLLQEYGAMYGVRFIVDRCGVLAGPWQLARLDQGIFAYWVATHRANRPLTYTGWGGMGKQVRDLLHIDDLAALVNVQLERFSDLAGQTYNVGGGLSCSLSLAEATELCRDITGNHVPISSVAAHSPADIKWYVSDTARVRAATGWAPRHTPAQILADIDSWLTVAEPQVGYLWRD